VATTHAQFCVDIDPNFFQWNDEIHALIAMSKNMVFECNCLTASWWVVLYLLLNSHHHHHQPLKFLNFHSMREEDLQPLNEKPFLERIVLIYGVGEWVNKWKYNCGGLSLSLSLSLIYKGIIKKQSAKKKSLWFPPNCHKLPMLLCVFQYIYIKEQRLLQGNPLGTYETFGTKQNNLLFCVSLYCQPCTCSLSITPWKKSQLWGGGVGGRDL
jgi:hypothetical protein